MREPVQYRPGEAIGSAHLGPLLEGQVRRHDQAHPLVRTTDDLEQQLGSELTEWDISQHDQIAPLQLSQQSLLVALLPSFGQFGDQVHRP